jgi:uridine kinase
MTKREQLLQIVAAKIVGLPAAGIARVAVDGVDGAGKTTFADELADYLASGSRQIIRASVDGFHNPRALRYRLGATSPKGFFLDSYNYAGLAANLLWPLSPHGSRRFRRAIFDHRSDRPVVAPEEYADADAILLFDGIFLHRPELRPYWDFSIFLAVNFNVSIPRCAARDAGSPDPRADANRRYVAGQQLYLAQCRPTALASLVVNNDDWENPFIMPPSG